MAFDDTAHNPDVQKFLTENIGKVRTESSQQLAFAHTLLFIRLSSSIKLFRKLILYSGSATTTRLWKQERMMEQSHITLEKNTNMKQACQFL